MQQRAGVLINEHNMLMVDVVFTALRIISNNIIKLGNMRAYKEKLSPDNIPYKVWQAKSPDLLVETWGGPKQMLQSTGMNRTIFSMALMGEVFWYVVLRDEMQMPWVLDVLNAAFLEIKNDPLTGDPIYFYGSGNSRVKLDPADIIHIPFKSLPAARRALNPVEYASIASALALAAYEFGSTWFSQGASPDFILTTDAKLGQEEVNRIAQKFLIEHGGPQQAHLPLVLDRGLKATKVMASPDEAQYLNSLEYARSVVASWFGIPADAVANTLQRVSPPPVGSRQESAQDFLQNCLSGYIVPLEEAMTSLLPVGIGAAWDEGKLTRPNAMAQADRITALRTSNVMSINEIRSRELGLCPVEGGDEVLAPLASNVSPQQTAAAAAPAQTPAKPPVPAKLPVPVKPPVKK